MRACVLRRGSILIIALWALSFLSVFALSMAAITRQKLALAERLKSRLELRLIAEAGVRRAIYELATNDLDSDNDSYREAWASNEAGFKEVSAGGGFFSLGYDYFDQDTGAVKTRYGLIDEERKINLNTAGPEVLKRLFQAALGWQEDQSVELAEAIIDWRDEDDNPGASGAENSYYTSLKLPYACKNAKFDILDELLLIRGVTVTIYQALEGYLTVYGSGGVNINTAEPVVLSALGLEEKAVAAVIAFRQGKDSSSGSVDDGVFGAPLDARQLSQVMVLEPQESESLERVFSSGLAGVVSNTFMVDSRARYSHKKTEGRVRAVLARVPLESGGYKIKVRFWRVE